jgi:predicted metal-dependent enzyme (double-stranded beta helix superfamily)
MTMSATAPTSTIRDCAHAIAAAIARHGSDGKKLGAAIKASLRDLMSMPNLLELGIPREGNNVAFSQYLYFDGELSIIIYEVPNGKMIPPHDHGIWETLSVYRGRIRHLVYERVDDQTVPGAAELRVTEERVLEPGDFAIVAPPADIHSFTALSDGTYGITVVNGPYKRDRYYYQPEKNTYVIRQGRNAR